MPRHAEKRVLPYAPGDLFDLVARVEDYPQFLPWCLATRVRKREDHGFDADMTIGFKVFREAFTTRVDLDRPHDIKVSYKYGPFRNLSNHWQFVPNEDGTTTVDFEVNFQFRSRIFERLIGGVFTEAVHRMVSAFEKRAAQVCEKVEV